MPQFDFGHVFWPQLIWLAIFFAILYFGIVQRTLPRLGQTLAAREDQLSGDLSTAEAAKAEADRLTDDYDAGVAAAQDAARARLAQARGAASASLADRLAAANAALATRAAEAQAALDAARMRALAEIESVSAEAASAIVEKLTGTRPGADEAAAATRAALAVAR